MQPAALTNRDALRLVLSLLSVGAVVVIATYALGYMIKANEAKQAQLVGVADLRTDMTYADCKRLFGQGLKLSRHIHKACDANYGGVTVRFYCESDITDSDTPVAVMIRAPFGGSFHGVRLGRPKTELDELHLPSNWRLESETSADGRLLSIEAFDTNYRYR